MIEAAGRDVDLIRIIIGLKRQLRATMGTEAAACLAGRAKARRTTLHKPKLGRPDAEPGHKRRTSGPPADRAMAIRFVERAARHRVTYPPAKAPALQHRGLLYKDDWRRTRRSRQSPSKRVARERIQHEPCEQDQPGIAVGFEHGEAID